MFTSHLSCFECCPPHPYLFQIKQQEKMFLIECNSLPFCFSGKHHGQKQLGKERVWLLPLPRYNPSLREDGVRTQAIPGAETMETHCSLDYAYLSFFYSPGPRAQGQHCPQWVGSFHVNQPSGPSLPAWP